MNRASTNPYPSPKPGSERHLFRLMQALEDALIFRRARSMSPCTPPSSRRQPVRRPRHRPRPHHRIRARPPRHPIRRSPRGPARSRTPVTPRPLRRIIPRMLPDQPDRLRLRLRAVVLRLPHVAPAFPASNARTPAGAVHSKRFARWSVQWGRWDLNPHCQDPKSCASAVGLRPRGDQVWADQPVLANWVSRPDRVPGAASRRARWPSPRSRPSRSRRPRRSRTST